MQERVFDRITDAFPVIGEMLMGFDPGIAAGMIQAAIFLRGIKDVFSIEGSMPFMP